MFQSICDLSKCVKDLTNLAVKINDIRAAYHDSRQPIVLMAHHMKIGRISISSTQVDAREEVAKEEQVLRNQVERELENLRGAMNLMSKEFGNG